MNVIRGLRAVFHFVRAGDSAGRCEFREAKRHIDAAIAALGPDAKQPRFFEYFLRKARIEEGLGDTSEARKCVAAARRKIERSRSLSATDQAYLLDFCDVSEAELRGVDHSPSDFRLMGDAGVKAHYRADYPLVRYLPPVG